MEDVKTAPDPADEAGRMLDQVEPETEPPACPCCNGIGIYLGTLGHRPAFRCRACGIVFGVRA
jgi:tRNA(Ile2) C34 agmatinyltransferase TiaS